MLRVLQHELIGISLEILILNVLWPRKQGNDRRVGNIKINDTFISHFGSTLSFHFVAFVIQKSKIAKTFSRIWKSFFNTT